MVCKDAAWTLSAQCVCWGACCIVNIVFVQLHEGMRPEGCHSFGMEIVGISDGQRVGAGLVLTAYLLGCFRK